MGLREQIDSDIKDAMKSGAKDKVSALRMLSAALKNKQIDKRAPLTDSEIVDTVRSLIKQRRDSIEQFARGGRQDLVDKETAEIKVIEEYLPAAVTDDEIATVVAEVVKATGASSAKDLGRVMKECMARFAGKPVDGKKVNQAAKALLEK